MVDVNYDIALADAARVDELEPLWRGMVEHHRGVAGRDWPVRTGEAAWARRRPQYLQWLADGEGWLLIGTPEHDRRPAGYAFVRLVPSGASWELGDRIGELESLAVAEHARGTGLGGQLIEAARDLLSAHGVDYWTVAVVEANAGAVRLYERHGFRPYYRQLLAPLIGTGAPDRLQ